MHVRTLVAVLLGWLFVAPSLVLAQSFSYEPGFRPPTPSYEMLLERLDQQERRIAELESTRRLPPAGEPWFHNTSQEPVRSTIDERFEALEAGLEKQAGALDGLKSNMKDYVKSGHGKPTMKIVGRVHTDFWGFPESSSAANAFETADPSLDPQNNFQFRRLRFGVRGDLVDNMTYRVEMEFAGGNKSEFRDAWLGWKDLPFVQTLLIGNQKRPYGLDHLNSSRFNVFMERPFSIEAINQDSRRFGIAAYGVSDDLAYNWRYGVYNQRLIQDEGKYFNDQLQLEAAGRFANTIWYDETSGGRGYAHWALSGTVADPDGNTNTNVAKTGPFVNEARFRTRPEARSANRWIDTGVIAGADTYELLGAEGVVNFGPWQWVTEWQNLWLQRSVGSGNDLYFQGAYTYLSYFLTGEHMPWERKSGTLGRIHPFENFFLVNRRGGGVGHGWGAWQVAARYSYADFSDEDIFGGVGESVTFGLNWYWTPYSRMQFNYVHGLIRQREVTIFPGTPNEADVVLSGDYDIVGLRFMVDF